MCRSYFFNEAAILIGEKTNVKLCTQRYCCYGALLWAPYFMSLFVVSWVISPFCTLVAKKQKQVSSKIGCLHVLGFLANSTDLQPAVVWEGSAGGSQQFSSSNQSANQAIEVQWISSCAALETQRLFIPALHQNYS